MVVEEGCLVSMKRARRGFFIEVLARLRLAALQAE